MKNLTWQNPEQLFVAQELINKVKSKCCGIKVIKITHGYNFLINEYVNAIIDFGALLSLIDIAKVGQNLGVTKEFAECLCV